MPIAVGGVEFFGDEVDRIIEFDPLTGECLLSLEEVTIYPNSHHVTPRPALSRAVQGIRAELKARLSDLLADGKLVEEQRLRERTLFDLEMMESTGSCKGIENYSRWLTGRQPGEPPPTLFEYLPEDALLIVDESHAALPQIGGMYRGDFQRKAHWLNTAFDCRHALIIGL